jgi:peptide/nickel transport system ATP-binding protein
MSINESLVVANLTKTYTQGSILRRTRFAAVNDVSFEMDLQRPSILTLAGESGSGKTTLGSVLLGLITPTRGTIRFLDRDLTRISGRRDVLWLKRHVQPVFQNPFDTFNPLKKIETYLFDTARNLNREKDRQKAFDLVEASLHDVGLSYQNIRGRYPNELSGGQLQRISIARAILCRPRLLVADEPVSMVDASLKMSIVNLFKQLKDNHGVSIIYVTHDLATAYYISDEICIMMRGTVVEQGPVQEVLGEPKHPYTRMLRESVPRPGVRHKWTDKIKLSQLEIREYTRRGCRFFDRCALAMERCDMNEPPDFVVGKSKVKCFLFEKPVPKGDNQ